MLKRLRPSNSGQMASEQSTLWPEALPAKMLAPRTASKAAKASTASEQVCSGKPCGWCMNCDPIGFSLRTSLHSELAAMTGYTMHWKLTATPAGRSWWKLHSPGHRTSAPASGSLPTPRCCNGLRSRGVNQTEIQRALKKHLPTPRKSQGGPDPTSHSPNLKSELKRRMIPSPRANKWGQADSHGWTPWKNGNLGTAALLALTEWMMGYPKEWLANSCRPTETP